MRVHKEKADVQILLYVCPLYFYLRPRKRLKSPAGSWERTTAASISEAPIISRPVIHCPKIKTVATVAKKDSRLKSSESTVGLEPFCETICKV